MIAKIFTIGLTAMIVTSCSGNSTDGSKASNLNAESTDISGKWLIETIAFSDSEYVKPSEIAPDVEQCIAFTDSTYFISTNCNSIAGSYTLSGDSIMLGDGVMTEMACDNMDTEDALRRILPDITTIDLENDSTLRLNCHNPSEYIILQKTKRK